MLRLYTLAFLLFVGLPSMAQQWVTDLYCSENISLDNWIEMYCTDRCKGILKAEYADAYEGEGYATWLLEGFAPGEDSALYLSSVETLQDHGSYESRLAVHIDVFQVDQMSPFARRSIVLDIVEQDGIQMVDSIECGYDDEGMLLQTDIQRKKPTLPKSLQPLAQRVYDAYNMHIFEECMSGMPEVAHCLSITRHRMDPGVGLSVQRLKMHGASDGDAGTGGSRSQLSCIKVQTYHPEAETLCTEYETVVYDTSAGQTSTPLFHFSTTSLCLDGKPFTLEQSFYFSSQGKVLHTERHLIDQNGKEASLRPAVPVSDGTKELKRATRLLHSYEDLMAGD